MVLNLWHTIEPCCRQCLTFFSCTAFVSLRGNYCIIFKCADFYHLKTPCSLPELNILSVCSKLSELHCFIFWKKSLPNSFWPTWCLLSSWDIHSPVSGNSFTSVRGAVSCHPGIFIHWFLGIPLPLCYVSCIPHAVSHLLWPSLLVNALHFCLESLLP